MQLASAEGLEDLSIARLAGELGMSKSGLFAHFGSKEELQLSTLRAARRVFSDEAVTPALGGPQGHRAPARAARRLARTTSSSDTFAGGCVFMEAAAEFDNRPGPVRDLIAETMGMWMGLLVEQAARALERGELAAGTDPAQLAWELHAFGLGLNWDRQLNGAAGAQARAGTAVRARLEAAATASGGASGSPSGRGGLGAKSARRSGPRSSAAAKASISSESRSSSSSRACGGEHGGAGVQGALEAVGVGVGDGDLPRHAALAAAQEHPPAPPRRRAPSRRAARSRARRPGRSRARRRRACGRGRGVGGAWWTPVSAIRGRPAHGTATSPRCGRPYAGGPVGYAVCSASDRLALEARLVSSAGSSMPTSRGPGPRAR